MAEDDSIVVHCSNKWSVSDINSAILKKAGFELTQSTQKTASGKSKILAKISAKFFGAGVDAGAESEYQNSTQITKAPLELDADDVNDIIAALDSVGFDRYIVLEDFHYLSTDAQRDFSVALKAYHEESKYCFIVVGVWLEENRLTVYNGDLTGRVTSINADRWEVDELKSVVSEGGRLLNVEFSNGFVDRLIEHSQGSVYIVQEACYQCCMDSGVLFTQDRCIVIGDETKVVEIVQAVVSQQTGRFNSFITQFSEGFQATTLHMHKWLLYPILTSSIHDLKAGLKYRKICGVLEDNHPVKTELNPGNITQAWVCQTNRVTGFCS